MRQLKLGIPKGSLENSTIALFGQAGWTISPHSRNYFPTVNDPEIGCALVRSHWCARRKWRLTSPTARSMPA